jgi:hypothetical protein
LPLPSQAFGNENIADRAPIPVDNPELATEAIFISGGRLEREWTGIEDDEQTLFRRKAPRASGRAELRRVDVCDPDLFASEPERIAIDHAGDPLPASAAAIPPKERTRSVCSSMSSKRTEFR